VIVDLVSLLLSINSVDKLMVCQSQVSIDMLI
jgi:hypothetical protein